MKRHGGMAGDKIYTGGGVLFPSAPKKVPVASSIFKLRTRVFDGKMHITRKLQFDHLQVQMEQNQNEAGESSNFEPEQYFLTNVAGDFDVKHG
ncbi:MAG: hypothetical protein MPK62_10065 [Alphaproteobacteria bacterium]|nr:hypothetical protein [Gammaproteobacteria bacterium]MDA8010465.1 hypothetical protein [Alphaproteobacteria bacterium]MDA8031446.1 hypothetical protein [Alphaproteobacteria bacterium]